MLCRQLGSGYVFVNPGSESVMHEASDFSGEVSFHLGGVSCAHFRQSLVMKR